jgi:hypothetical protein
MPATQVFGYFYLGPNNCLGDPNPKSPLFITGFWRARRDPDPQIRSLVLYSGAAICLIIPCSTAPTLSNNIIQKGLAFGRDWSGGVVNSGR